MSRNKKRRQRGFTLVELVVTLAVASVLIGLTIPGFYKMQSMGRLKAHARKLVADVRKAQTLATAGGMHTCPGGSRVRFAGVRVGPVNVRRYSIFGICNDGATTEITFAIQILPDETGISFTAPVIGSEVRFRRNGTVITQPIPQFDLRDPNTGMTKSVTVNLTGHARIIN